MEPISFPPTIPIVFLSSAPSVFSSRSPSVHPSMLTSSVTSLLLYPNTIPTCNDESRYSLLEFCALLQKYQIIYEANLIGIYGVEMYKREQLCSECGKCVKFVTKNHPNYFLSNNLDPLKEPVG